MAGKGMPKESSPKDASRLDTSILDLLARPSWTLKLANEGTYDLAIVESEIGHDPNNRRTHRLLELHILAFNRERV
jgi:hypothetical protein